MRQQTKIPDSKSETKRFWLISLCLIIAIIAVYWPVYKYEFLRYDDDAYVTNNKNIQSGFNFKNIQWAFTSGYAANWHPITWMSHTLDYQLFKNWAGGHHLVNILFHTANTLILFLALMRMTKAIWPSAFIAAAFALHPLHVESVAWIAERKDVLSTFFWFLTMFAYVRYIENKKLKWYLTALMLFVLGLMSKPMLVTLPFVLLLLDYWPLQRKITLPLLIEKIPFFICSFLSSVITYLVQQKSGAMIDVETLRLKTRIANALISYITYATKMIWPSRLAALYPHPGDAFSHSKAVICGLLLILSTIILLYLGRRRKYFIVGGLWFIGTLIPVIGLVQVGAQSMADRYTYIPLIGLFIIIAFGARELFSKKRNILFVLAAIILVCWGAIALYQVKYWKNSLLLFEHTLRVHPQNPLMIENYATYLSELGRYDEAIEQSDKFLKMKPNSPEAHNNLGTIFLKTDKISEAIEQFQLAIKYNPSVPQAYYNLGNALKKINNYDEAVRSYQQVIKLKPDYIDAYLNLAITSNEMQKFEQTIETCNKLLELEPANVFAHGYKGMALAGLGRTEDAIKEIQYVLQFRPNDIEMHRNLGILFERNGQTAQAIQSYRNALRIDPNDKTARLLLDAAEKK